MVKKIISVLAFVFLGSMLANAQFVVGGGIKFGHSGGTSELGSLSSDLTKTNTFNFFPKVGYFLSDDLIVGAQLGLEVNSTDYGNSVEKSNIFSIAPFARYYAYRLNKFSLFVEGNATVGFGKEKVENGPITTDNKITKLALNVFPGIGYALSDKVLLSATINGLNLNASKNIEKSGDDKMVYNNIGFGASMNNVLTTGGLSVSVLVKF